MEIYIASVYENSIIKYNKSESDIYNRLLEIDGYIIYQIDINCAVYIIDICNDFSKNIDPRLLHISNKIKSDIRNEKLNILIDERK